MTRQNSPSSDPSANDGCHCRPRRRRRRSPPARARELAPRIIADQVGRGPWAFLHAPGCARPSTTSWPDWESIWAACPPIMPVPPTISTLHRPPPCRHRGPSTTLRGRAAGTSSAWITQRFAYLIQTMPTRVGDAGFAGIWAVAGGIVSRRFEGKSVLITGAAGAIGRATAHRLRQEGARLALADRAEADGRLADEIAKAADAPRRLFLMMPHQPIERRAGRRGVQGDGPARRDLQHRRRLHQGSFDGCSDEEWNRIMQNQLGERLHHLAAGDPASGRNRRVHRQHILPGGAKVSPIDRLCRLQSRHHRADQVAGGRIRHDRNSLQRDLPRRNPLVHELHTGRAGRRSRSRVPALQAAWLRGRARRAEGCGGGFRLPPSEDARFVSGTVLVVDGAQFLLQVPSAAAVDPRRRPDALRNSDGISLAGHRTDLSLVPERAFIVTEVETLTYATFASRTAPRQRCCADAASARGIGSASICRARPLWRWHSGRARDWVPSPLRSARCSATQSCADHRARRDEGAHRRRQHRGHILPKSETNSLLWNIACGGRGRRSRQPFGCHGRKNQEHSRMRVRPRDIACLFFTSGTTGSPKGTAQRTSPSLDAARHDGLAPQSLRPARSICRGPLFTNFGLTNAESLPLCGGPSCLHERWDSERVLADIAKRRDLFRRHADHVRLHRQRIRPGEARPSSLRVCTTGGSPVPRP